MYVYVVCYIYIYICTVARRSQKLRFLQSERQRIAQLDKAGSYRLASGITTIHRDEDDLKYLNKLARSQRYKHHVAEFQETQNTHVNSSERNDKTMNLSSLNRNRSSSSKSRAQSTTNSPNKPSSSANHSNSSMNTPNTHNKHHKSSTRVVSFLSAGGGGAGGLTHHSSSQGSGVNGGIGERALNLSSSSNPVTGNTDRGIGETNPNVRSAQRGREQNVSSFSNSSSSFQSAPRGQIFNMGRAKTAGESLADTVTGLQVNLRTLRTLTIPSGYPLIFLITLRTP